jgi:translocation and assembly module TamB
VKKKVLCGLAATGAALFFAALYWLMGTTGGALWLMRTASAQAGAVLSAEKVEGRMWGDLRIEGLRVAWKNGMFHAGMAELQWRPLSLLSGTVSVRRLELDDAEVIDSSPERRRPVDLSWPHVSGFAAGLDLTVDMFRVNRLTYRRPAGPAIQVNSAEVVISWHAGTLDMSVLDIGMDEFRAKGSLSLGMVRPSLFVSAAAAVSSPVKGINHFFLDADLRSGNNEGAEVSGGMTLTGAAGDTPVFSLTSTVGIMKTWLTIRDLSLLAGGRRGALRGEGRVDFPAGEPMVVMRTKVYDLDLSPEVRTPTHVSGFLDFAAAADAYNGSFDLANYGKKWRHVELSGSFAGGKESVLLHLMKARWLNGELQGTLDVAWKSGLSAAGTLSGRRLDPAALSPEWYGSVNFDMDGRLTKSAAGTEGVLSLHLPESSLRGRALNGEIEAGLRGGDVILSHLLLEGKGFVVRAGGELKKRISFSAKVSDLSGLVPGTKGRLSAEGWARVFGGVRAGALKASGGGIDANGLRIGTLKASGSLGSAEDHPVEFTAAMTDISYQGVAAGSVSLSAQGTEASHSLRFAARNGRDRLQADFKGGYKAGIWRGELSTLAGWYETGPFRMTKRTALSISAKGISLSPLVIRGEKGESIELSAEIKRNPLEGALDARWERISLSNARTFARDFGLSGVTSGRIRAELAKDRLQLFNAEVTASGRFTLGEEKISFTGTTATLEWTAQGLSASFSAGLSGGGTLSGSILSPAPAAFSLPEQGEISLGWEGIELAVFRKWVPRGVDLEGRLSGKAGGKWTQGRELGLDINASVADGRVSIKKGKGIIGASIRSAVLRADWHGSGLKGNISFALTDYGKASAEFTLPVPARLPVEADPAGKVFVSLDGRVHENGLLTALFPGLVQESRAEMDIHLGAEGIWDAPVFSGRIDMQNAGAYFPMTGINIKNVRLRARLDRSEVSIESFHAESGSGSLDGTAVMHIKGWHPEDYHGTLKGERFQVFYLPEMKAYASPDLSFEGTAKKVSVKGDLLIPELIATGASGTGVVKTSPDVIVTDREKERRKKSAFAADIRVKVILGDRVLVKEQGFDAQLGGTVEVTATDIRDIRGSGRIDIVKGHYSVYGVKLDVSKGKVLFNGGPADNPSLDVLALRTSGDVKAGVLVTGTVNAPQVRLYSEPAMADTDTLAYIVLGHPLSGGSQEEAGLMVQAAGQLLSAGQSVVLQDRIKRTLGLDTLDVESGGGTLSRSMATVGKYLTPKLYVSYGRALFGSGDLFKAKYSLSKRWEADVTSGFESGADIFYKIEFR